MTSFKATPPTPFGSHGLIGCQRGDLVLIGTEHGRSDHVMCAAAALELRDWISANVAAPQLQHDGSLHTDVVRAETAIAGRPREEARPRTAADIQQEALFAQLERDRAFSKAWTDSEPPHSTGTI